MSTDHLDHRLADRQPGTAQRPTLHDTERAVLAVLAGETPDSAAAQISITATDLTDAIALYQEAGRAALARQAASTGWYQVHVELPDWETAEGTMVSHLLPVLRDAETEGTIAAWWFVRKAPCWRLRIQAGTAEAPSARNILAGALDGLTSRGMATRWWPSIYEPEMPTFGGPAGMAAAHRLFHDDSRHILGYLGKAASPSAAPALGRRELSVILCAAMVRAARLDWQEQGDVWHRVTHMRPLPSGATPSRLPTPTKQIRHLLGLDTSPTAATVSSGGPLAPARAWLAAFTDVGHSLGVAARTGMLHRGLRDVLAHHVVFHWNRLGIGDQSQSALAYAAVKATLNLTDHLPGGADVAST